jgi:hypothetical protein
MKRTVLLVLAAFAGAPVAAQDNRATATVPSEGRATRDLTLERAVSMRNASLSTEMHGEAREKLDLAARAVLADLSTGPQDADPDALARQQLQARFGRLSTRQADVLSFYVLARVVSLLSDPAELERNQSAHASEMASLRMQMMLDRRSKLMSTLSNLMKRTSDTQKSVIQNIK